MVCRLLWPIWPPASSWRGRAGSDRLWRRSSSRRLQRQGRRPGTSELWREPLSGHPPLELVDVNDDPSAQTIADGLRQIFGVLRTRVEYVANISDVIHLPLLERYWINDSEMGWADEPFRMERIKLREDGRAIVRFVSYNEAP